MGSTQTKEETIIAQTAAGNGKNSASADTSYSSTSVTNILLTVIVVVVLAAVLYAVCRFYKKTHENWIEKQMNRRSLRRSQTLAALEKRPTPRVESV